MLIRASKNPGCKEMGFIQNNIFVLIIAAAIAFFAEMQFHTISNYFKAMDTERKQQTQAAFHAQEEQPKDATLVRLLDLRGRREAEEFKHRTPESQRLIAAWEFKNFADDAAKFASAFAPRRGEKFGN